MLYVLLTSSIGLPSTGPIGAGLEGFVGGWLGLDCGGAFAVPPSLSFCWLVSPLLSDSLVPPEQQLPMVEWKGEQEQKGWRERKGCELIDIGQGGVI